MGSWRTEWKAIADRIRGLLEAGEFFVRTRQVSTEDAYRIAQKHLSSPSCAVFDALKEFQAKYHSTLPASAQSALSHFISNEASFFGSNTLDTIPGLLGAQVRLTALAAFCSEFTYLLTDVTTLARRLSAHAFVHLQRSIVADLEVRNKWQSTFKVREEDCEKLGGVHLLLHWIWTFKANAAGERTDLVLGEP